MEWSKLEEKIKAAKNIAICSHINPDGDNIGSILAMGIGLKSLGIANKMWRVDRVPKNLKFLKGIDEMIEPTLPCDLLIVVDCSDELRLGKYKDLLPEIETVVNIDHHRSNNNFGHLNFVNPLAAATGELVFSFLKHMGVVWNDDIASPLYVALSTDTGSFKYSSTTPNTLRMAATLLENIKNYDIITENIYQSRTLLQTNLLSKVLSDMKIIPELNTAIGQLDLNYLNEVGAESDDTDSIVSFLNDIDEVKIAVFIKETKPNIVKVSLRCKGEYDVASIAEAFGGGGHKKAAGLTIEGDIKDAENKIVNKIKELYF